MMFGLYEMYLNAISTVNLTFLFPIGIGLIIGGIICLFIMNLLFKIAKSYTYFAIIGFILGSIFVIYPGFTFDLHGCISIILFILCFIIGDQLSKFSVNKNY